MGFANSLKKCIEPIWSESVWLHEKGAQLCGWLEGNLHKWIGRQGALKYRCSCQRNCLLQNSSDDIQLTSPGSPHARTPFSQKLLGLGKVKRQALQKSHQSTMGFSRCAVFLETYNCSSTKCWLYTPAFPDLSKATPQHTLIQCRLIYRFGEKNELHDLKSNSVFPCTVFS